MIRSLTVENYALIDRLDLEPGAGLNIITGETGAGKSILLGALSLLLGGKADASVVSDPERNCVVEGQFAIDGYGLEELFAQNELDYAPEITIRRVVTPKGTSRAYINDLPVQPAALKEIVLRLVDIHSQHQSLAITDEAFRTEVVDAIAGNGPVVTEYRTVYADLLAREKELAKLHADADTAKRDEEYLRFQLDQLTVAGLKEGETAALEAEQGELTHAGNIREALEASLVALDGMPDGATSGGGAGDSAGAGGGVGAGDAGALQQLKSVEQSLGRIAAVYPRAAGFAERVHAAAVDLKDVLSALGAERERIDADPARLETINARLSTIYALQQKHRAASEQELLALRDDFARRLTLITDYDAVVERTAGEVGALRQRAVDLAARITAGRRRAAAVVERAVVATLKRLGMNDAALQVDVAEAGRLGPRGADRVEFLFSANKNVAPQPVARIASGGEISRLMLAVKALVAHSLRLPTIIFDEIDSGVSGAVADAMGEIIAELSASMQVVNITHLPQVASKGQTHMLVYKESGGPRARTLIRTLTPEERVAEIARMLSGSVVTDAAIAQARLLLG